MVQNHNNKKKALVELHKASVKHVYLNWQLYVLKNRLQNKAYWQNLLEQELSLQKNLETISRFLQSPPPPPPPPPPVWDADTLINYDMFVYMEDD